MNTTPHRSICRYEGQSDDENSAAQLTLSGELSEYLFATKFWSGINQKCGTLFDQFEDETAEGPVLNVISSELASAMVILQSGPDMVCFVRGWTQAGESIEVVCHRDEIAQEMADLRNFIRDALTKQKSLNFDL